MQFVSPFWNVDAEDILVNMHEIYEMFETNFNVFLYC